ncbi:hypothetical protein Tco_1218557 [Tanacetum coccineum]
MLTFKACFSQVIMAVNLFTSVYTVPALAEFFSGSDEEVSGWRRGTLEGHSATADAHLLALSPGYVLILIHEEDPEEDTQRRASHDVNPADGGDGDDEPSDDDTDDDDMMMMRSLLRTRMRTRRRRST